MAKRFTRRNVLIGLGAVGATATAGAAWLVTADPRAATIEFIKESLPGVTIDEASAGACYDDFMAIRTGAKDLVIGVAWGAMGVERMAAMSDKFDELARKVLTAFLVDSNFFHVRDPSAETIRYVKKPEGSPCVSPFANLAV